MPCINVSPSLPEKSFFTALFANPRQTFERRLLASLLSRRLALARIDRRCVGVCSVCTQRRVCHYELQFDRHASQSFMLCKVRQLCDRRISVLFYKQQQQLPTVRLVDQELCLPLHMLILFIIR
jgi:hypothetical protein